MNKAKLIKQTFTLLISFFFVSTIFAAEKDYSSRDEREAIIYCMTVEYINNYQHDPAKEDIMPKCKARFKSLKQELSYTDYKKYFLEKLYTPYPDQKTTEVQAIYHGIMMGDR